MSIDERVVAPVVEHANSWIQIHRGLASGVQAISVSHFARKGWTSNDKASNEQP